MRHVICLSGLLRIHLNLRRYVVFLDFYSLILVHFILNLIMFLFNVIFCNSSSHETNSHPYYVCYAQLDFASPMDNTDIVLTVHDS